MSRSVITLLGGTGFFGRALMGQSEAQAAAIVICHGVGIRLRLVEVLK